VPRASHGGLAVAADPQRQRLLHRFRTHGHLLELPEIPGVIDVVPLPAQPHDADRLVCASTALLEGDAGGAEFPLLLDTDADGGEHAAVREVVDHGELAGGENG
jgi:hypothetical protein